MTNTLAKTVALITGASSGIGAATASALAREGAAVAVLARRRDRLEGLKDSIESAGGTALVVPADVADARDARAAVERVVTGLGRLDIVVNNAGLMRMGPAAEASLDDWDEMVRCTATVSATRSPRCRARSHRFSRSSARPSNTDRRSPVSWVSSRTPQAWASPSGWPRSRWPLPGRRPVAYAAEFFPRPAGSPESSCS